LRLLRLLLLLLAAACCCIARSLLFGLFQMNCLFQQAATAPVKGSSVAAASAALNDFAAVGSDYGDLDHFL